MTISLVVEPVADQCFIQHETPLSFPLRLETLRNGQTIPTRTTPLTL